KGESIQPVARAPRRNLKDHSLPSASASRSPFSTRALEPLAVARMPLTTSAARRNPMCIFGASPMIGGPLLLNRAAASIMPGATSLIGLKNAASAAVSVLASPSLSVSDRLGINSFLSLVGLPETDDPAFPAA